MANREIEAILKISSKLGSMKALSTLRSELAKVNQQANAFNRTQSVLARTNGIMAMQMRNGWAATTSAIGPAVAAYAGVQAIKGYAAVERHITQIGITAGATESQTAAMMTRLRNTATEMRVPFQDVVAEMDSLVSSGKSFDEAYAMLAPVGKAAKASGADFADMATTADALSTSLGITATQMEGAFDVLAFGGKAGKFELRDMAAELPSLTPAFAALGYKGPEALKKLIAMMQGVRKETGTSSEAATALQNVFQKMNTDDTTKKFKKFGIDSRKALKDAKDSGKDLLDTFIDLSFEAVHGDMDKLPQLFTDAQFLQGMRALMNQRGQIKAWQSDMSNAAGTVSADFKRTFADAQSSLDQLGNSLGRLSGTFAQAFGKAGGVGSIDAVSNDFERLAAALDGGWTPMDSLKATLSGDDPAKVVDAFAWKSGMRTPEQRKAIDAYAQSAASRTAPAAAGEPVVQMSRADVIKAMQQQAGIAADGRMNKATIDAIEAFQGKAGIKVDGKVGGQTVKAFNAALSAPVAPGASAEITQQQRDDFKAEWDRQGRERDARDERQAAQDERQFTRSGLRREPVTMMDRVKAAGEELAKPVPKPVASAPMEPSFRAAEEASMTAYRRDRAAIDNAIEASRPAPNLFDGFANDIDGAGRSFATTVKDAAAAFTQPLPRPAASDSAGPTYREAEEASMATYRRDINAINNAIEASRPYGDSPVAPRDIAAEAKAANRDSKAIGAMLDGMRPRRTDDAAVDKPFVAPIRDRDLSALPPIPRDMNPPRDIRSEAKAANGGTDFSAMLAGMERVGADVGQGGQRAGDAIKGGADAGAQSIEQAAQSILAAGQEGGSAFSRSLEGVGARIGAEAAAAFKANVGSLTVNARVSGPVGGAAPQGASGNKGQSMTGAGRVPGGV